MISVGRLAPGDQWDQNMLDQLFGNDLYPTGLEFERVEGYPRADGAVVLIPGRYWADRTGEISEALARYEWVLAIRAGDEEDILDITKIVHPNLKWWVQTPRADRDYGDARLFGVGFPPHFNRMVPPTAPRLDVFLSAQNTHARRDAAFAMLRGGDSASRYIDETDGFTHGIPPIAYRHIMASTKVAPAPSGAYSPDTFRVYEALEAHAVPIADDISPAYHSDGYWRKLFPDCPFPILRDYADLPGYIDDVLADYPRNANRIAAWWIAQKRRMAGWLREDLTTLGAPVEQTGSPITVLVSTSPIKSHPDTAIIDETIASILRHLPGAEIILMHDGVRPEQDHRRADYEAYMQKVLWSADHRWRYTLPLIFEQHLHQAVCTKRALDYVHTPVVLFVEGDTPLTDGEIPWAGITDTILAGDANCVRFSHEASILAPHRHLMLDDAPQKVRGVPMTRTIQWSQRPHLASTAWYRALLDRYFPGDERDYIEDRVYGRLIADYHRDGDMGWLGWRTWLYTPDGDIKRSCHTDGRAGESKFV